MKRAARSFRALQSIAVIVAALVMTSCAPAPQFPSDKAILVANGREIARVPCGRRHAADASAVSPRADAPPFRTILRRYRQDVLTEELINGIKIGHPDMSTFAMNPQGVDDLIAYLRTLDRPSGRSADKAPMPTPSP